MTRKITATDARVHFGELLRRVTEGEETVVVERAGRPAAVVVSITAYERMRSAAGREPWGQALEEARELREKIETRLAGRELPSPVDVITEARQIRDEELWNSLR